jgi:hypothetical protein
MRINSRAKGKSGEQEFRDILEPVVGLVYLSRGLKPPRLKRNTLQSDGGGYDILGIPFAAIEVKRCEQLSLEEWWSQAKSQAAPCQIPILAYRQNKRPWRVRMGGLLQVRGCRMVSTVADINLKTFLTWLTMKLELHLDGESGKVGHA